MALTKQFCFKQLSWHTDIDLILGKTETQGVTRVSNKLHNIMFGAKISFVCLFVCFKQIVLFFFLLDCPEIWLTYMIYFGCQTKNVPTRDKTSEQQHMNRTSKWRKCALMFDTTVVLHSLYCYSANNFCDSSNLMVTFSDRGFL